jgi:3-oxoadipate enol-lactonase
MLTWRSGDGQISEDLITIRIEPRPRIAVDIQGRGPLLLFLHGIGGNRDNWREQLTFFATHGFTAAAWDARGYGGSDDYESALDFGDFSSDLLRVIDHFEAERTHLCGLSMGGRIALDFYDRHASRVATLTLCDTQPGLRRMSEEKRREFIRLRQEPLLSGKRPADIAPAVAETLVGPNASQAAFQRLVDSMSALRTHSYLKTIEASFRYERTPNLEAVRIPTHIVVGADDKLTPPELARQMAKRIPGAELTVIPNAGHCTNIEQPGLFNEVAFQFLRPYRDYASIPVERSQ